MFEKVILLGIGLMVLSTNAQAFLTNTIQDAYNYLFPGTHSTAMRSIENEVSAAQKMEVSHDVSEVRDDVSFQKAILQIRLKAAHQFIQERTKYLEEVGEKKWEINKKLLTVKCRDLEGAEKDVKIIERTLQNPSEFNDWVFE